MQHIGHLPDDIIQNENVAFGLRARGVARGAARVTAHDWLERMGLAAQARQQPYGLRLPGREWAWSEAATHRDSVLQALARW